MYTISIVYDDPKMKEMVLKAPSKMQPFLEFYDMNTIDGRKNGFKIKGAWGARKNPFVLIEGGDRAVKVLYSENNWEDNAVEQLLKFLNND